MVGQKVRRGKGGRGRWKMKGFGIGIARGLRRAHWGHVMPTSKIPVPTTRTD